MATGHINTMPLMGPQMIQKIPNDPSGPVILKGNLCLAASLGLSPSSPYGQILPILIHTQPRSVGSLDSGTVLS